MANFYTEKLGNKKKKKTQVGISTNVFNVWTFIVLIIRFQSIFYFKI